MSDKYNEFDGESGLKDDYDGVIVDAWFAVNANADGKTMAYMKVAADDGDEVELRYGLGADWTSFDEGETVEHPKDTNPERPKRFNNQVAYHEFVSKARECGAEDELMKRSRELFDKKGPKAAKIWIGLKFHFEVSTTETTIRSGKDEGKTIQINRTLPTAFLGVEEIKAAGDFEGGSGTNAAATPAAAAEVAGGDPLESLSAPDQAKIKLLAQAHSFPEWVDQCLTQWADNATLVAALGDENGLYSSLKG